MLNFRYELSRVRWHLNVNWHSILIIWRLVHLIKMADTNVNLNLLHLTEIRTNCLGLNNKKRHTENNLKPITIQSRHKHIRRSKKRPTNTIWKLFVRNWFQSIEPETPIFYRRWTALVKTLRKSVHPPNLIENRNRQQLSILTDRKMGAVCRERGNRGMWTHTNHYDRCRTSPG